MKIQTSLVFATIFLFHSAAISQIQGTCIDEKGNGIPYVNITVKGKTYGTVSNLDGDFNLDNSFLKKTDTLVFSHINFETKTTGVFNNNQRISLTEKVENLDEVFVTNRNRRVKEKIVGTKTKSGNVILQHVTKNLGSEVAKIIKVKKNRVYDLKKVYFNVFYLGYESATFRVNFYPIKNGIAETNKVNYSENIIQVKETGMVEIDISNQNLSFEKDFLTSIEWIDFEDDEKISGENKVIHISSTVFSGPFTWRENVTTTWEMDKVKYNTGVGIHLLVESFEI